MRNSNVSAGFTEMLKEKGRGKNIPTKSFAAVPSKTQKGLAWFQMTVSEGRTGI